MSNEIIIWHEPGLGDYFLCNGLVNYFSQHYSKIFLPTYDAYWHPNFQTVKCLYADNPKVVVLPLLDFLYPYNVDDYFESFGLPILKVVRGRPRNTDEINWFEDFYAQFDLPFEYRYSYFQLPKHIPNMENVYNQVVPHDRPYRIVHDSTSGNKTYTFDLTSWRTGPVPDLETIRVTPDITSNLIEWVQVFKNATEIHVLASSVFWLIDSIRDELTADLYYHDRRIIEAENRTECVDLAKHSPRWQFISYDDADKGHNISQPAQPSIDVVDTATDIVVWHRAGLGDHFIAAGLVNILSQTFDTVYLICSKKQNYETVKFLFSLIPNIKVVPFDNPSVEDIKLFAENHHAEIYDAMFDYVYRTTTPWFKACYEEYSLPYDRRYTHWPAPKMGPNADVVYNTVVTPGKPYVVIHNTSSERESYDIDLSVGQIGDKQIINVTAGVSDNLFDWVRVFENASEIHVVDSSVFHLIDNMSNELSADIYFHHTRLYTFFDPPVDILPYSPRWKIVYYSELQ